MDWTNSPTVNWPDLPQPLAEGANLLSQGGPVLGVIGLLSVLALALILFKVGQYARLDVLRTSPIDVALAAWRGGDPEYALAVLAGTRNPAAQTIERAMRGKRSGVAEAGNLAEDVARDGVTRIAGLRNHLRLLELIATLSPLLGLLGTVLGMIDAFQALEEAGSRVNPAILSGGIWVALLTTAAGLIVAIPVAAAHNLFEGVVERVALTIEDAATQVLVSSNDDQGPATPVRVEHPRLAAEPAT